MRITRYGTPDHLAVDSHRLAVEAYEMAARAWDAAELALQIRTAAARCEAIRVHGASHETLVTQCKALDHQYRIVRNQYSQMDKRTRGARSLKADLVVAEQERDEAHRRLAEVSALIPVVHLPRPYITPKPTLDVIEGPNLLSKIVAAVIVPTSLLLVVFGEHSSTTKSGAANPPAIGSRTAATAPYVQRNGALPPYPCPADRVINGQLMHFTCTRDYDNRNGGDGSDHSGTNTNFTGNRNDGQWVPVGPATSSSTTIVTEDDRPIWHGTVVLDGDTCVYHWFAWYHHVDCHPTDQAEKWHGIVVPDGETCVYLWFTWYHRVECHPTA